MKKQYQTRVIHGNSGIFVTNAPVTTKAYAIKKGKELVAFMNDMRGHKVPKGYYNWEVRTFEATDGSGGVVAQGA